MKHKFDHAGNWHPSRETRPHRAPRAIDRLPAEEQVLELAVARVIRNCQIALDTRQDMPRADALALLHPVNNEALFVGMYAAQLVHNNRKA